ncbi:unnamed protein product, partial [Candidula unifasciata]
TYLMNAVHKHLFRVITTTMAGQDAEINKITRNLVHLQFSDLGIRKIFSQNIPAAKKELNLLNRYSTPVGRLFCLKRVVATLTKPPKSLIKENSKETVTMMTTDDLLPILIFLIIKSEIPNWMANLVFMRHFHFAKSSDDDEFGFYLASVEAALEHIKSGNIGEDIKPLKREHWNSFLVVDSTDGPPSPSSSQSPSRQLSHSSIDDFFKYVQEGNEMKVQQMLERPYKTSEEVHLKLCHPLCSCDKCDKLLSDFRSNSDLVTAYTRDNRGYTALHIAAYYGQALLIDLLIQNNAVVETTDYLGLTPLHLACQRGFQNVMLLLLHFGADVMATDNEGNTPLHLCCANGHDDCVKALVFYEASMKRLQINVANEFGDTALHLAAKWGYETIVKTLLENGADATVCNRKKQTPVSLAQNVKVQRCLQLAAEDPDFLLTKSQFLTSASNSRSRASSTASVSNHSSAYTGHRSGRLDLYEPESASSHVVTASLEVVSESEMKRKREKLFKAVIEGDIQLVKFYLGIQLEVDDGKDDDIDTPPSSVALGDMCHPLCQCQKCLYIQRASRKWGDIMSVNSKTSTGYCPIHMAVLHHHKDVVALLIAHGADVSAQNHKSLTPLHLAVCTRNTLVTDMLVKAGARLNMCDVNGDTPLLISAGNGFIDGVQILIKANADLNAANHKGNTALHEAVKRNYTAIVSILLHAGADPRIKNKHGHLPQDESNDASLQGVLVAAARRLEEAEKLAQNNNNTSRGRGTDGQVSIKELFAAFEDKDLQKLQNLALAIRSFNQEVHLRRTTTKDTSSAFLGVLTQQYLIHKFDRESLRKTKSLCKSEPPSLHAVLKSRSFDTRTDRPSSDTFSTDRSSMERIYTDTLTSDILSTDSISQDFDTSLQDLLSPMGDKSFDTGSSFDDSLNPLPESSSLDRIGSNSSSEPAEDDMSSTIEASNNAGIPVTGFPITGVLTNYTNARSSTLLTSEAQQKDNKCYISQSLESPSAVEESFVAEVKHTICDVSSSSCPSANTQSDDVNSLLVLGCGSEVSNSLTAENVTEVIDTVDVGASSVIMHSPVFEHAREVYSSLKPSSEVNNSLTAENGTEVIDTVDVGASSVIMHSPAFKYAREVYSSLKPSSEDKHSLHLECGREDKNSLDLSYDNEEKYFPNVEDSGKDKNFQNVEHISEDKNYHNVERILVDKNVPHLECNSDKNVKHSSEDKNSCYLECGSEASNLLNVKHDNKVHCDIDDQYSLVVKHEREDTNSLNFQHETNCANYLPDKVEQTASHCYSDKQSEELVIDTSLQISQSEELVKNTSLQTSQSEELVIDTSLQTSRSEELVKDTSLQTSQSEELVTDEQIDTRLQNSKSEELVKDSSLKTSKSEELGTDEQIDTTLQHSKTEELVKDTLLQTSHSEELVKDTPLQTSHSEEVVKDTSLQTSHSEELVKDTLLQTFQSEELVIDTSSQTSQNEEMVKDTLLQTSQIEELVKDTSLQTSKSKELVKDTFLQTSQIEELVKDTSLQTSKSEELVTNEQIVSTSYFHNSVEDSERAKFVQDQQIIGTSFCHSGVEDSQGEELVQEEQLITSLHCNGSVQDSHVENLVSSLNQPCNDTGYFEQPKNVSENAGGNYHRVTAEHSSVRIQAKELLTCEQAETRK